MVRRTQMAFTLVELLVVISIIALLVGMLVPSLVSAVEISRRAACRANMREIPRACGLYARNERYHRNGEVGTLPTVGPSGSNWHSGANANRQSLWKLVDLQHLSPGSLVCPSVEEDQWDTFANGQPSALAYLSMVGRTVSMADKNFYTSTIIVGDRNPRYAPNSKSVIGSVGHSNSLSHRMPGQGPEGQNVGRMDGSVKWLKTTKVSTGTNANDYIYEAQGGGGVVGGPNDVILLN